MGMKKDRATGEDRKFIAELYPDSISYDFSACLDGWRAYFTEWAYIVHDQDTNDDGSLKKPHVHLVGRVLTPRTLSAVSSKTGIPVNFIQFCESWKKFVRYLVHADDPDKFQYPHSAVHASFDFSSFMGLDGSVAAKKILDYMCSANQLTWKELILWSLDSGCWSEFSRNNRVWYNLFISLRHQF